MADSTPTRHRWGRPQRAAYNDGWSRRCQNEGCIAIWFTDNPKPTSPCENDSTPPADPRSSDMAETRDELAPNSDITDRLRAEFRVLDRWPGMDSFDSGRGETKPHPTAVEAVAEIEVLRHIVRVQAEKVAHPCNWAWMKGSPADKAYERALVSGSGEASSDG